MLQPTMSGPIRAIEEGEGPNLIDSFHHPERASWDEFQKEHFVKLLCSYDCPPRKNNRWSKEIWVKISNDMKAKFPECSFQMEVEKLKQLERDIKKKHKSMKKFAREYHLHFDKEKSMLVTSDEEWQQIFKLHPKAQKWHGKVFPYYAKLDDLYGDEEDATSENHQALHDNANPTHQNPEEEIYDVLSPLTTGYDPSYIGTSIDGNVETPNQADSNNTNPFFEALPMNLVRNQGFSPIHSQHRVSSSHISTSIVGANPGFLTLSASHPHYIYLQCLLKYNRLPGFDGSDVFHATKILEDTDNCQVFLSFDRANRAAWMRQMIDGRKQQAG